MMASPEHRSRPVSTIAIMVLGALAWSGCGPGRTVHLPNGYECIVDSAFVAIQHPARRTDALSSVGRLDAHGVMVLGTRVDERNSDREIGYFTLDTATHDLDLFDSFEEFAAAARAAGIQDMDLRWPGPFFNAASAVFWVGAVLIPLAMIGTAAWCVRWVSKRSRHTPKYPGY